MKRLTLLILTLIMAVLNVAAQVDGETNLATGATASASGAEGCATQEAIDANAARAIDSDHTGTQWSGNVADHYNDIYWQLQFASSTTFNTIRINYNNQAPKVAKLQYSDNGTSWTDIMTVGSTGGNAGNDGVYVYKFTAITAQYIRIQSVEGGTYGMGFNDFAVYNATSYHLSSIDVTANGLKIVKKPSDPSVSVYAYDQFGDPYTDFSLSVSGVGAVINSPNPTQPTDENKNPFVTTISVGAVSGENTITVTATDNTNKNALDAFYTATDELTIPESKFTTLYYENDDDFVTSGTTVTFTPKDVFGDNYVGLAEGDITLTGSIGSLSYTKSGDAVTSFTWDAGTTSGLATITVTKDAVTQTKKFYVIGDDMPAPGIPKKIYMPVYSNGDTHNNGSVVWQGDWDEKATIGDEITLNNGQVLKVIKECGQVAIGNGSGDFGTEKPAGGLKYTVPTGHENGDKLNVAVFAASDVTVSIYNEATKVATDVAVPAGTWKEITTDTYAAGAEVTTIKLKTNKIDGVYPSILVSNVYFSKNVTGDNDPYFTGTEVSVTTTKTSATIHAVATDASSSELHFIVYDSSNKLVAYQTASKAEGATNVETDIVLSDLTVGTTYTGYTIEVYDEAGNGGKTTNDKGNTGVSKKTIDTFTTLGYPTWSTEPTKVVGKTTVDITVQGTSSDASDVHYVVKNGETQLLASEAVATNTETTLNVTGLTADTEYTLTVELYDAENLKAATDKIVTFTTSGAVADSIVGNVGVNKDIAELVYQMSASTFNAGKPVYSIIDTDGETMSTEAGTWDIKYIILNDPQNIISTDGLSQVAVTGMGDKYYRANYDFTINANVTGSAIIRITATYTDRAGNSSTAVPGHYTINAYNPNLTVTINVNGTNYSKSGTTGNMKSLIADIISENSGVFGSKTYLDIDNLTISGTLDTRDLRILREMGGVIFNEDGTSTVSSKGFTQAQLKSMPYYCENGNVNELNAFRGSHGVITTSNGTHGALTNLNLASATFTLAPEYTEAEAEEEYNRRYGSGAWAALDDDDAKAAFKRETNVLLTLPVKNNAGEWEGYDWYNTGNLYNINQFVFMGCVNLEKVTLPYHDGIYVGQHAFEYCENLVTVNNIDKVVWFDANCFNQDQSLVGGDSESEYNGYVKLSNDCMRIAYVAFQGCKVMKLYSRHLPDNINFIGDQAFAGCNGLDTYIVYPNNPSEDVAHMASGVFLDCKKLKVVYVPSTTITFGYQEFEGCDDLRAVVFYDSESPVWESDTYESRGSVSEEYPTDINGTIASRTDYENFAFTYSGAKSDYSLRLRNIIANAFPGDEKLQSESIKAFHNVKLIGNSAFTNVKNLTDENLVTLLAKLRDSNDRDDKDAGNSKVTNNGTDGTGNDGFDESLLNYTIGSSVFKGCDELTTVVIPSQIVEVQDDAFADCKKLATVTIGENVAKLGYRVFEQHAAKPLRTVNVSRSTVPEMVHPDKLDEEILFWDDEEKTIPTPAKDDKGNIIYQKDENGDDTSTPVQKSEHPYYNVFNGCDQEQINLMTVNFSGAAQVYTSGEATVTLPGYKSYRANLHFLTIMTKELKCTDTDYTVAPQQFANVKLNRPLVAGWNTLALPFGSPKAGKDVNGAQKFANAMGLDLSESNNYIATYRGLYNNQVFRFLNQLATDGLNDFEPLMVKSPVAKSDVMTFEDVDVNIKHTAGYGASDQTKITTYTAAEMKEQIAKQDGNVDDSFQKMACFKDNTFGDYQFNGIYYKRTNTGVTGSGMDFIKPGDYIIQGNNFVECVDNYSVDIPGVGVTYPKYQLKGFRGWFQLKTNAESYTPAKLMIQSFFGEDLQETTEIIDIDPATGKQVQPQDIYSLNGQLVRGNATSTAGLAKGIYIMGGKKIVVK